MTTLKDVARAANVDVSAVSFALTGKGNLSAETRERILKIARELNYRPNLLARSLAKQRTLSVGLLANDLANPYFSTTAQAAARALHLAGYRLMIMDSDGDDRLGLELLEYTVSAKVDGIIAMTNVLAVDVIRAVVPVSLPLVCCAWEGEQNIAPAVAVDYVLGGQLVADHFLSLGHRRIGAVQVGPDHVGRMRGFRAALAANGQLLDPQLCAQGDGSIESGRAAGRTLFALPTPPTAVFVHNDFTALGVLAAAQERGLRVPADVSIVGFDDIFVAEFTAPPLTTVRTDVSAVVADAIALLLAIIDSREVTPPAPRKPELVVRQSTGPAP
jgi:DNA-binding LacI/PurR family transcriptional regulator